MGGKTDSDPCRAEERKLFVGMLRKGEQRTANSEQQTANSKQHTANSKETTANNLDNSVTNTVKSQLQKSAFNIFFIQAPNSLNVQ